jgi:hypothetical protein
MWGGGEILLPSLPPTHPFLHFIYPIPPILMEFAIYIFQYNLQLQFVRLLPLFLSNEIEGLGE